MAAVVSIISYLCVNLVYKDINTITERFSCAVGGKQLPAASCKLMISLCFSKIYLLSRLSDEKRMILKILMFYLCRVSLVCGNLWQSNTVKMQSVFDKGKHKLTVRNRI